MLRFAAVHRRLDIWPRAIGRRLTMALPTTDEVKPFEGEASKSQSILVEKDRKPCTADTSWGAPRRMTM
jgi:hypothetical protein